MEHVEMMIELDELVVKLFDVEAFKFGSFKLKSGLQSPIYIDLRVIISYPEILRSVAHYIHQVLEKTNVEYDSICGVPYTALPIASIICVDFKKPMLIRRKEAKSYGTKKLIEGQFNKNDRCVIIEDIVTSGSSVLETATSLREESLSVTDAVVFFDRQQNGENNLKENGINLHRVLTINRVLEILFAAGKLDLETVRNVQDFVDRNQTVLKKNKIETPTKIDVSSIREKLRSIVEKKKTNLCVSADLTSLAEIIELSKQIGEKISILKIHSDILQDFSVEQIQQLKAISRTMNFLLLEDRKFADIGNTVALQYGKGHFRIADWADLVTVHALPGEGIVQALEKVGQSIGEARACLLIAQMSSKGALTDSEDYVKAVVNYAEKYKQFVVGFISQSRLSSGNDFFHLTPGVHLNSSADQLGQQYVTPKEAIEKRGADILIVGRAILESNDRVKAVEEYRAESYRFYETFRQN